MAQFVEDCLRIIFTELQNDQSSLYSCILVNRFWCRIAVPILWKNIVIFNGTSHSTWKRYNIIIYLLSTSSKQLLFDNNIMLPLSILQNPPLFNYISFSSQISAGFISKMIHALIKKEDGFDKFKENYKKNLLEQEIYKLFINNCKNIKKFYWSTEQPLSQYPGASTCFSQLNTLNIDLQQVSSTALFGMAQVCQNIKNLCIHDCNGDIPGLISFIDIQKNLQSLTLCLGRGVEKQRILSEVIERKAVTLTNFTIMEIITSLSPRFLPSLINLEYLTLYNYDDVNGMDVESVEMQEWHEYLSISSFPNLKYLETGSLPVCIDYKVVEKSHGNILAIQIFSSDRDSVYNKELIKAIARNCPKIEKLYMDAEPEDLDGLEEIFLNCTQLKDLNLSTLNDEKIICDKLLQILINFSPKTLCEFSFNDSWNFSVNGLQNFFEYWRGRIPLKFEYYIEDGLFTEEHLMIMKKYHDEGVIILVN